jgi:hypothetical protein
VKFFNLLRFWWYVGALKDTRHKIGLLTKKEFDLSRKVVELQKKLKK